MTADRDAIARYYRLLPSTEPTPTLLRFLWGLLQFGPLTLWYLTRLAWDVGLAFLPVHPRKMLTPT